MTNRIAKGVSDRILQYLREEGLNDELPDVAALLQKEADRRQVITVISAAKLTEHEHKELIQTLTEKWGEREVVFTEDPGILSGMIVAFRDQIIDMSGKNALSSLSQQLS